MDEENESVAEKWIHEKLSGEGISLKK